MRKFLRRLRYIRLVSVGPPLVMPVPTIGEQPEPNWRDFALWGEGRLRRPWGRISDRLWRERYASLIKPRIGQGRSDVTYDQEQSTKSLLDMIQTTKR